jgi:hypothetical protein
MRKIAMMFFAALLMTLSVSAAYAEVPDRYFDDDFSFVFLNPQPLPP